ncbi:MAG: rhomboid protease GluP [Blastocatellia bacterium]
MSTDQTSREPAFRVCTNCGNLTPAEQPACNYCGTMTVEAMAAHQEAEREHRFLGALIARSNPFTMIIIGINAAVFLLEWLAGGMGGLSADSQVLRAFGAKNNELINQQHQYWRLVTPIFIHIGFLHFLLNNYALWVIGQEIERLYGSARFVILYLLTGVAGSLASYTFNPGHDSAGASGAIFGLFGVMATFAFRFRKELPTRLSTDIRRRILPVIAINLIFGFSVRIVDNAAHVGGLLAGVGLALLIPYQRPNERGTAIIWRISQVICLALMLLSFVAAFYNYDGPKLSVKNLKGDPQARLEDYDQRMNRAHEALVESLNSFMKILRQRDPIADIRPALDAARYGINDIQGIPPISKESDQFRAELLELLDEQRSLIDRYAVMEDKNWAEIDRQEGALIQKARDYKLIKSDGE